MSRRLMSLVAASAQRRAQRARVDPEDRDAPPGVAETPEGADEVDGEVELPPGDMPEGPLGAVDGPGGGGGGGGMGFGDPDLGGAPGAMPAPPAPPADPAVVSEIRNVRDQIDLVQRDNQDTQELLRDLVREVREVRLEDASPEARDQEVDRMKENLADEGSPASPAEFGMPNATRKGSRTMDLRTLRRQRVAAARRTAQSDAHGEIFPTETGINLEDDHWGADVQEDEQRTTPPTPDFTTDRGLDKITRDSDEQAPEWMAKESALAKKGFDLEFVPGKNPFYVVSDLATRRPIATFMRPAKVAAETFANSAAYGKGVLDLLDSEGFERVMAGLKAKPVDEVLAARIRAARIEPSGRRRAQAASSPAATPRSRRAQADAAPAAPAAPAAVTESVFDDPTIAAEVDRYVASRDEAFERCFKLAMSAAVAGQIDNPLKGAMITLLGNVIDDPAGFCDDAIAMSADRLFSVLYRQAREWMQVSPETLISIEGMITRRGNGHREMQPRFASSGRSLRDTPASLRRRAVEGSDVPMSVDPGVTGWGDGGFEEDTLVARIRHSLPVMEAHSRVRRLTAGASVPRGRFGG